MKRLLRAFSTTVGMKFVMAITGLLLSGFLVAHLAGNLLLYVSNKAYCDYAHKLHSMPAFLFVAAALVPGSDVTVERVGLNPTRTGLPDVLARMGADITIDRTGHSGGEPLGSVRVRASQLQAAETGGAEIVRLIDEIPVLAVAATLQIAASFYPLIAAVLLGLPFLGWLLVRDRLRHAAEHGEPVHRRPRRRLRRRGRRQRRRLRGRLVRAQGRAVRLRRRVLLGLVQGPAGQADLQVVRRPRPHRSVPLSRPSPYGCGAWPPRSSAAAS